MSGYACFLLGPTDQVRLYLRRYRTSEVDKCPARMGYHNAMVWYADVPVEWQGSYIGPVSEPTPAHTDPRWPTHCECGEAFRETDTWQLFQELLYRHVDTGVVTTIHEAPIGAMWYADWMPESWHGPDGHCLVVKTPGGDWIVDGRASNCTRPDDWTHRCWVREGTPPRVTAGKSGNTCSAGAGSILIGTYHGFLRDGWLTP